VPTTAKQLNKACESELFLPIEGAFVTNTSGQLPCTRRCTGLVVRPCSPQVERDYTMKGVKLWKR